MTSEYGRRKYNPAGFNLPRDELEVAMGHILQAIEGRPDGKKPFIVLNGPPGVGKTWLLEQIRHELHRLGVRCAEIVQTRDILEDPGTRLAELLQWCLQIPKAEAVDAQTSEDVQELSNRLDLALRDQALPLALFFDDLDYLLRWLPTEPKPGESIQAQTERDKRFQMIYILLWWAVLRHTHLPGLVICASRESLPAALFSTPMIRKLQLVKVNSLSERLSDEELDKVVTAILLEQAAQSMNPATVDAATLQGLARRYACGHLLVVDWLAWKLGQDGRAFEGTRREESLGDLVRVLIDNRLEDDDQDTLIRLARDSKGGFSDSDPILGVKGPSFIRRLKQVGLVDLIPGTQSYKVSAPLACLYAKEASK